MDLQRHREIVFAIVLDCNAFCGELCRKMRDCRQFEKAGPTTEDLNMLPTGNDTMVKEGIRF